MKDIIIIGTGKAALLHYNSYNKLNNIGNIFFVDIKKQSEYLKNVKIYPNIVQCIQENCLEKSNVIIDICTPKSEFIDILNVCKREKLSSVLIEKPFIINKKELKKYNTLNIVMVQNYLYSKVTQEIKEYLISNKKEIDFIYTNFSKNRTIDSSNGRGCRNDITINYEIEIPHQVYLTQYFLNQYKSIENRITCSQDMQLDTMNLKNHGYGLIISKCNDVNIVYKSNLTSDISQKKIIICTKDGYVIEGNYAIYDNNLKLVKKPNINIYYKGKRTKNKNLDIDDNFTYFINDVYNYFNKKTDSLDVINIEDFSSNMQLYCKNILNTKK